MTDFNRVNQIRRELEDELGCAVIIWTVGDYPGTPEQQQERFAEHSERLCDRLIELGNEAIASEYGVDEDSDES